MPDFYKSVGVSAEKQDVHAAIKAQDPGLFPGAFCKLIPDPAMSDDSCAALHADGAGTKSALAYLYWRETGDESVFEDLAQDALIMNIDDLACIGATDGFLLSNTIGRSSARIPGSIISRIINGYDKCISLLEQQGVSVTLCGGETADVGDLTPTLIVDSTAFCRLKRSDVIDCARIAPGDVIIGFASFGKAEFESRYNSGIGSNGLTAARHLLLHPDYRTRYPETYSSATDKEFVYCGKYHLSDPLENTPLSVGEALLSPTRPYAGMLRAIFSEIGRSEIHGLIHCTGGGQTKCRKFGHGVHYIKDSLFDLPPVFRLLAEAGVSPEECCRDFNLGHRLEMMCPASSAQNAIQIARSFGIEAKLVGRVEASPLPEENRVSIRFKNETYTF